MLVSWDLTGIFYEVTYIHVPNIYLEPVRYKTPVKNTLQKDDCYIQSLAISVNIYIDMF